MSGNTHALFMDWHLEQGESPSHLFFCRRQHSQALERRAIGFFEMDPIGAKGRLHPLGSFPERLLIGKVVEE